jgi:hypothetical protein
MFLFAINYFYLPENGQKLGPKHGGTMFNNKKTTL